MAHSYTGHDSPKIRRMPDGTIEAVYTVVELDAEAADEVPLDLTMLRLSIKANTNPAVVSYFNANLTTPGAATTIRPAIGREAGWTLADSDHVLQAAAAAAVCKSAVDVRFVASGNTLYWRSTPDAASTRIDFELVVRLGHRA